MLTVLFSYHINRIKRHFEKNRFAKLATVFLFLLLFAGVGFGIYSFLKEIFRFTLHDSLLTSALTLYVYEMFLLFIGYLVFFSSLISGTYLLFKSSRDNRWIMASPHYDIVPEYSYLRTILTSLWPFFIIGLPVLLAMKTSFPTIGFFSVFVAGLAILLFVAFVAGLALASVMLLAKIYNFFAKGKIKFGILIGLIAIFFVFSLWVSWQHITDFSVRDYFQVADIEQEVGTGVIKETFQVLPSHLPALSVWMSQYGETANSFIWLLATAFIATISGGLFLIFSRWHLELWQKLQEGNYVASSSGHSRNKPAKFPRFFKSPLGAVFEKEVLVNARTMKNVLWFGFFAVLFFLQTGLNNFVAKEALKFGGRLDITPEFLQVIQFATAMFFVAAFVLRFAFPSFSTERKTAWILASSPLNLKSLFKAKWLFYTVSFSVVGTVGAFINLSIIDLPISGEIFFFGLAILAIVFLTTLGLSLGAIFPNFETDDAESLSTSAPGLGFIFVSLGYGAFGARVLFDLLNGSVMPFWIFVSMSFVAVVAMMYFAPRRLNKIEFSKTL